MSHVNSFFYTFGNPIATDSLLIEKKQPVTGDDHDLNIEITSTLETITMSLGLMDKVYGFGQSVGGFNKRGQNIVSYCSDDPVHTEEKKSLYGAHNFFVISSGVRFTGVFVDASCKVTYDIGLKIREQLTIQVEEPDYRLLILEATSIEALLGEWFQWIGKPYLPPAFGLGYIQSRWGYDSEKDIRAVIDGFEAHNLPLDGVCLDIDYMERYKDFTIDTVAFPEFEKLCQYAKHKGIHLVPIIDAGVKIESGYKVYEEGVEKGLFCTDASGAPFVGAVWPGLVHFPDFLNPEARTWFGHQYKVLLDLGVDGFWNDMNEPAIFFTPERLKVVKALYENAEADSLDVLPFFDLLDGARTLINYPGYQDDFYHQIGVERVVHRKVHNQYGYRMTQSAHEGLRALSPQRKLLFSRASLIGAHRHGGLWMGDNASWWSHLKLNMSMLVGMNMSGFLYIGADTGGFSHDTEPQLMIRWHQLSMFTPLLRNHSALGTLAQEPYVFEKWALDALRTSMQWRYRMVFWQFSNLLKATLNHELLFKPLEWAFDTRESIEDQVVYGDGIMLAPVYERNQVSRLVEIPEKMLMLRLNADGTYLGEFLEAGIHRVSVPLDEQVIYLKKNVFMVLNTLANQVKDIQHDKLTAIGFVTDCGNLSLYAADETYAYETGQYEKITFDVIKDGGGYHISIEGELNGLKQVEWVFFEDNQVMVQMRMEVESYDDTK